MDTTLTLAEIQRRHVAIAPHEAVAIAQQLMRDCSGNLAAKPPFGLPSLETVAIGADGSVYCTCSDTTPSTPEVAIVLQQMIAGVEGRVPGGLRYAVGRALLEVEAPPFDSTVEFGEALERFERGDRAQTIGALYAKAIAAAPDCVVATGARGACDRRRRTPPASEIRRQLRDADLRLYQIQQLAEGAMRAPSPARQRSMRAPVAACMLTGLALVAVGEVTRGMPIPYAGAQMDRASTRVTPAAVAGTRPEHASGATVVRAVASDIALPAQSLLPTLEPAPALQSSTPAQVQQLAESQPKPVAGPQRRVTHVTSHRANPRAAAVRAAANRQPVRPEATRSASRLADDQRRQDDERRRDDDSALLRIRFEWNNPFK